MLFATLMSVFNGASIVGTEVGAALAKVLGITESNFDNLVLLTAVCNLTSLYLLLFIGWLDEFGSKPEEELEREAEQEAELEQTEESLGNAALPLNLREAAADAGVEESAWQ